MKWAIFLRNIFSLIIVAAILILYVWIDESARYSTSRAIQKMQQEDDIYNDGLQSNRSVTTGRLTIDRPNEDEDRQSFFATEEAAVREEMAEAESTMAVLEMEAQIDMESTQEAFILEADSMSESPVATGTTANRNANLRGGPGTNYPVLGGVRTGQVLTIIGRNHTGDWLQLVDGRWIAAFLVKGAPAESPVVGIPIAQPLQPAAQPTPIPPPTATPAPAQTQSCDPSYPTLCIPPNSPDSDCPDISARRFPVLPPDPHRFDGDHDGIGCES